jgi:CheY-like chemotaxis protein/putative methionine-R-sulfoxide reductase with GAF domain
VPPELAVACVDADTERRELTLDALAEAGFETTVFESVAALDEATTLDNDCVVTATTVPDGDAFDVARAVRRTRPDTPVILFDDAPPDDEDGDVERTDVLEFVSRDVPMATDRLVSLIERSVIDRFQVGYPLPDNEAERLEALDSYGIAAEEAAAAFDRITALVKAQFDITVAFVGLVDEHEERFVSCTGAGWERLDREETICTHTIVGDNDVMVVEDVSADPRFAANDTLRELDIRSYAGVALMTADGQPIGALCAIHDEPRSYSAEEIRQLRMFAAEVEDQLQLRRQLADDETDGDRQ